jgi:hypothetical protein
MRKAALDAIERIIIQLSTFIHLLAERTLPQTRSPEKANGKRSTPTCFSLCMDFVHTAL